MLINVKQKILTMKKNLTLCLLICMLIACKKESSDPIQLLKNTEMQFDPSLTQTWFNYKEGTGFVTSWTNEESFSPSYSLKISRTTTDNSSYCFYGQSCSEKIRSGSNLTLKAKIKGVNLSGQGVTIAIRCDGDEGKIQFETTQNDIIINGTFDWTTYTINLSNINNKVKTIVVLLIYLPNTSGIVYFDDVVLTQN